MPLETYARLVTFLMYFSLNIRQMEITVENVDLFYRSGRGKSVQFYTLDRELNDIFQTTLPAEYNPYSLVCATVTAQNAFLHIEGQMDNFLELRENGFDRFYLRSKALTPDLKLPDDILSGSENGRFEQYYAYKGLIEIMPGWSNQGNLEGSSLSFIDKLFLIDEPEVIYENADYLIIYKKLEKSIKTILRYKTKHHWLDGRTVVSKVNNVSEAFANAVKSGKISVKFEIV
jgi:hypothetical protein